MFYNKVEFLLESNLLTDNTGWTQVGNDIIEETYFLSPAKKTDWNQKYRSEFEMTYDVRYLEEYYNFLWEFTFSLTLSQNLMVYKRKTSGFLDWMADWGGLFDGLTLIAQLMTHHYSIHALRSFLAKSLVRIAP